MALRKVYNILCCNQTLKKVYLHNGIPRSIFNPLNVTLLNRKIKKGTKVTTNITNYENRIPEREPGFNYLWHSMCLSSVKDNKDLAQGGSG